MRLRNWLLTGTSVAVLALAPIGAAKAQSAELLAAYQTYVTAQESGDSTATDAALVALTELCIVEGFATVEECIAAAEAAVAAESDAETDAAAAAAAEAEAQAAAEAEAQAAAEAEAQAAAEAEAQAAAEAEAAAAAEAEAQAAADAEAAAASEAEAQAAADAEAQFVADLNAALGQYQEALNLAAAGDYESAQPMAVEAEARIQQLCTDNGYPSVEACIGQSLPPLPEPPAAEEPMATEEPAAEEPAAEEPATEEPIAEETPATEETTAEEPAAEESATDETPAEQPAEADPLVAAQADLQTAVELYNIGVTQLEAGDADGQSTVDAAMERITTICTELGFNDTTECLSQFGFSLPPLPETPVEPAADEEQPIEELPGSEAEVTPEATEVLPEEIAPEEAAPVLDSAKEAETAPPAEETAEQPAEDEPAEEVAEEPAAPAPTTDEESQAAVEPLEVESVTELQGEQVSAAELPEVVVPPNVTVVNNIATEGRRGGDGRDRDDDDDDDRDRGNNFTNSGFIFQIGLNLVISNPAQERDRYYDEDEDEVYYERLPRGRIKETIVRPSGVQIVTIRNRYGEVIRRSRIMPDGREIILAGGNDWDRRDRDRDRDDRDGRDRDDEDVDGDDLEWRDPGRDLPPLRLNISIRDYILDADEADEDEVEEFLAEPPVERVRQIYTIDEVKRSARIRDMVRRLEVGGLTFDSGAATISRNQVGALSKVANAMLDLLDRNPAETFLIEGHTDAVGSETSNLVLSDSRAATVARILTDFYDIPPENLVTQGYGERFLKVQTEDAERLNRRVTIKRITPLITVASR